VNLGKRSRRPTRVPEPLPKVSPILAVARAMAEAKHVDAGPSMIEGGYSPMTRSV